MTTPAQASGHPNFITDVPVQGPTDPGMREADCRWVRQRIPTQSPCVDCGGPIPMWARQTLSIGGRGPSSGIGENISFGGTGVAGFALGAAGDPDVFAGLTPDQQAWVRDTLVRLDGLIRSTTGTSCPSFGPSIPAASGCFQGWWNQTVAVPGAPVRPLRTDGVFDADTLAALKTTTEMHSGDFPQKFPEKKGLSKGAMIGIAAGAVTVASGVAYVVLHKKKRRS